MADVARIGCEVDVAVEPATFVHLKDKAGPQQFRLPVRKRSHHTHGLITALTAVTADERFFGWSNGVLHAWDSAGAQLLWAINDGLPAVASDTAAVAQRDSPSFPYVLQPGTMVQLEIASTQRGDQEYVSALLGRREGDDR